MNDDDLASYLLARLNEEAEAACKAGACEWTADEYGQLAGPDGSDLWYTDGVHSAAPERDQAFHIARWDPARVLAEVESKRRIVEFHSETRAQGYGYCPAEVWEEWPCTTLRLLAHPYADRDDFRQEWKL